MGRLNSEREMKLLYTFLTLSAAVNSGRLEDVVQSKEKSNEFLTPLNREKRFLVETVRKRGSQYKQYCKEDLKELILYRCPVIGKREGFTNLTPCGVYEEAREHASESLGNGESGEEFDEEANSFGCDFYEECCGEGCKYDEIGQEECF